MIRADSSALFPYHMAILPDTKTNNTHLSKIDIWSDLWLYEKPPDILSPYVLEVSVCSCRMPLSNIKSVQ